MNSTNAQSVFGAAALWMWTRPAAELHTFHQLPVGESSRQKRRQDFSIAAMLCLFQILTFSPIGSVIERKIYFFPPFTFLAHLKPIVCDDLIGLRQQNCYYHSCLYRRSRPFHEKSLKQKFLEKFPSYNPSESSGLLIKSP